MDTHEQARNARAASRILQQLSSTERENIINQIVADLEKNRDAILEANEKDKKAATGLAHHLKSRLSLDADKLTRLGAGLSTLARCEEPLGKVLRRTELSDGLILEQVTVAIGVLLIIFESRPDCLPQIASLAIRSGNGLLLKGGKEAAHSNAVLHQIIVDAVHTATKGRVARELIVLVKSRDEVSELLKLDDVIDLVIPRGSAELVTSIQKNTKIPVLGHSEGICHIYIDPEANIEKAVNIIVDAKLNYPSACNAVETVLFHTNFFRDGGKGVDIIKKLQSAKITVFGGPKASKRLSLPEAKSLKEEYGDERITIEIVDSVQDAIDHIHKYGSSHTDGIVTENKSTAELFLSQVDSACVFHNASTRFADGIRFGLGSEVGISTGRIHARGPVGVDGLTSTKWLLRAKKDEGFTVTDFEKTKKYSYTHRNLLTSLSSSDNKDSQLLTIHYTPPPSSTSSHSSRPQVCHLKIRPSSQSKDIVYAIRARFQLSPNSLLRLTDSSDTDVLIDRTLVTGEYTLHVPSSSL